MSPPRRPRWALIAVLTVATLLVAVPAWAPSTFTPNLNLEKPADGDLNWGGAHRTALDILDTLAAPTYVTGGTHPSLIGELVLTAGTGITITPGAGTITVAATGSVVGTPVLYEPTATQTSTCSSVYPSTACVGINLTKLTDQELFRFTAGSSGTPVTGTSHPNPFSVIEVFDTTVPCAPNCDLFRTGLTVLHHLYSGWTGARVALLGKIDLNGGGYSGAQLIGVQGDCEVGVSNAALGQCFGGYFQAYARDNASGNSILVGMEINTFSSVNTLGNLGLQVVNKPGVGKSVTATLDAAIQIRNGGGPGWLHGLYIEGATATREEAGGSAIRMPFGLHRGRVRWGDGTGDFIVNDNANGLVVAVSNGQIIFQQGGVNIAAIQLSGPNQGKICNLQTGLCSVMQ